MTKENLLMENKDLMEILKDFLELPIGREELRKKTWELSHDLRAVTFAGTHKEWRLDESYIDQGQCPEDHHLEEIQDYMADVPRRLCALENILTLHEQTCSEELRKLVVNAYKTNESSEVRDKAGELLGYGRIRIKANQVRYFLDHWLSG